jgi:hypothetical protein
MENIFDVIIRCIALPDPVKRERVLKTILGIIVIGCVLFSASVWIVVLTR